MVEQMIVEPRLGVRMSCLTFGLKMDSISTRTP